MGRPSAAGSGLWESRTSLVDEGRSQGLCSAAKASLLGGRCRANLPTPLVLCPRSFPMLFSE